MTMRVRSVNVPWPADDAGAGVLRLRPAAGSVAIGLRGFQGEAHPPVGDPADPDGQAFAHALYAYPTIHHPVWQTLRAQARVAEPGAPLPQACFDEHLALDGVQESQLWVGDVLRFPACTLVVSGPRPPDARFDETLGFPHAAKMVAQSCWCGFWLGVRVPGRLAAGDPFELVPGPRASGLVELFRARTRARR